MTPQLPQLAQIALCSGDLPRLKRFYMHLFGFEDARGETMAGRRIAHVQGREPEDSSYFVWWLTGRQQLMQFELFQYNDPRQRPLPIDWRVSDIGWSRFGIAVADFDACLARVRESGARPFTDPVEIGGRRRFAFRDPYIGLVHEVIEDGEGEARLPAIANMAVTVSDLESARKFWIDDLGLPEDPDFVAGEARERLWGQEGADVSGFCVRLSGMAIEVMAYRPAGRPIGDRGLYDHGVTNIGLLFRDRDSLHQMIEHLRARGHDVSIPQRPGPIASLYMTGPEQVPVELFCVPEQFDERVGFIARSDMRV